MYFAATAWLSLGEDFILTTPWRQSYFIPVLVYLGAAVLRGARFSFLFSDSARDKRLNIAAIGPYQEAAALNNVSLFYFADVFIYWFYKPFVHQNRLIGAIALNRVADYLFLGAGLLFLSVKIKGPWIVLFAALSAWTVFCFWILWTRHRNLLRRRFWQMFALSLLAWLMEWLSLALMFLFISGKGEAVFAVGWKNMFNAFLLGPQLAYKWFFLVHFVLGFASLLLISYREGSEKE